MGVVGVVLTPSTTGGGDGRVETLGLGDELSIGSFLV